MKSYHDLEIYQKSFEYAITAHKLSLKLPKHELYEIGSQLRRSTQSIKDNIVEGYGRRNYKAEFIRFLIFSQSSLLEAVSQLEMLKALYQLDDIDQLLEKYIELGKQIHSFINYVSKNWKIKT
ncbi:MAG: four helix bundle protein [Bacteroidota bacterium]